MKKRVSWKIEVAVRSKFHVKKSRLLNLLRIVEAEVPKNRKLSQIRKLRIESVTLGLYFVGTSEIKKLNTAYRNKAYATDVLSFEGDLRGFEPSLGELVFCVPVLKRQAKEHKLSQTEEFEYLYLHGLLHLLGYDHETSKSAERRMLGIQDRLFELHCQN